MNSLDSWICEIHVSSLGLEEKLKCVHMMLCGVARSLPEVDRALGRKFETETERERESRLTHYRTRAISCLRREDARSWPFLGAHVRSSQHRLRFPLPWGWKVGRGELPLIFYLSVEDGCDLQPKWWPHTYYSRPAPNKGPFFIQFFIVVPLL